MGVGPIRRPTDLIGIATKECAMTAPMPRRLFLASAAASGLALTAAACSDPSVSSGGGGAAAPADWPGATDDLSGVELTFWAAQSSKDIPAPVIEGFQEATGATINLVTMPDPYEQNVQTKVATGDTPDLSFWQPTASQLTVLNPQNLQPIDGAPFVESYTGDLATMAGLLDEVRYAALVSSPAAMGMFYSKALFAEQGIDAVPTSWDEMIELARELKSKGVVPFFSMAGDMWATQWWVQLQLADAAKDGLWEQINTNQAQFSSDPIQGAINTFRDLIEEGLFNEGLATATYDDQANALLNGEAAMCAQISPFADQALALSSAAELDQKIGFFPISGDGAVPTFHPDQSNAIVAYATGDEARERAARQFMLYWLTDGYQPFIEARSLPSIVADVDSPDSLPELMTQLAQSLDGAVGSMQAQAVANPDLALNLQKMIQGTMTAEEVGSETQAQFAQLAAAAGVEGF